VITREQLDTALEAQRSAQPLGGGRRARLGHVLVDSGVLTERELVTALGIALGYELIDLGTTPVDAGVGRLLPRAVAQRHGVVPLSRTSDGGLKIAVADPTDVVAIDDVRVYTGVGRIQVFLAPESQIRDALGRIWSLTEDSSGLAGVLESMDTEDALEEVDPENAVESAPTVRLVNVVLADAVRTGASDIHVEPQVGDVMIRYRVDGLLREVMQVPRSAARGLVSRIKVLSNLDIAERRLPQDGRARLNIDGSMVDVRVSTLPSIHGEKVVIRILSRADAVPGLDSLGLDEQQLETLLGVLASPQGLILITGPTGSGKTNTLYSAISQVRRPELNIVTLEDPVEIQLRGITQVQVHERAGLTFSRGLRSILRQDPDVVLVGEVRDQETAKLALEASLTGHLVLTTLHTNNAPAALTRLVEMGVEPFLVASSLSLVVAQRLVRCVCRSCAAPYVPSPRTLEILGLTEADLAAGTALRGRGCTECGNTGYRGRTGIFQVLPVTAALRAVLLATPTEAAVGAAAQAAGMTDLRASAIARAMAGVTTFEEVLRVAPGEAQALHEQRRPAPPRILRAAPKRPKLLVVDDDPAIRAYVAMALVDTVEVDSVATAGEALTAVETGTYQAIIVDQGLPDSLGVELIGLLSDDKRTAGIPVMLLTGFDDATLAESARAAGACDVLHKPVEPLVLEERVLSMITGIAEAEESSA